MSIFLIVIFSVVFTDVYLQGSSCVGFHEVLEMYNKITPTVHMHRPTNFAPLIYKAIDIVRKTQKVCKHCEKLVKMCLFSWFLFRFYMLTEKQQAFNRYNANWIPI